MTQLIAIKSKDCFNQGALTTKIYQRRYAFEFPRKVRIDLDIYARQLFHV